jgi:hypothetical protein
MAYSYSYLYKYLIKRYPFLPVELEVMAEGGCTNICDALTDKEERTP